MAHFTAEQADRAIDHAGVDRGQQMRCAAALEIAGLEPPQDLHRGGKGDGATVAAMP
jgi:hypothetical protein